MKFHLSLSLSHIAYIKDTQRGLTYTFSKAFPSCVPQLMKRKKKMSSHEFRSNINSFQLPIGFCYIVVSNFNYLMLLLLQSRVCHLSRHFKARRRWEKAFAYMFFAGNQFRWRGRSHRLIFSLSLSLSLANYTTLRKTAGSNHQRGAPAAASLRDTFQGRRSIKRHSYIKP